MRHKAYIHPLLPKANWQGMNLSTIEALLSRPFCMQSQHIVFIVHFLFCSRVWGCWLCTTEMSLNLFLSFLLICDFFFFLNTFFHVVSQSPAIMHMLDKSGSCGKFDNYQRPEGFPVGTCDILPLHILVAHWTVFFCWQFKLVLFPRSWGKSDGKGKAEEG